MNEVESAAVCEVHDGCGPLVVRREGAVTLTPRGRMLGGGVTARLLA